MINIFVHRKSDPEFVKSKLGIENLEELKEEYNITSNSAEYPRYSGDKNIIRKDSLAIIKEFGHINFGENISSQLGVMKISKKRYKNFKNSLKPCIKELIKDESYDKAILEIESMFERTEEDTENLYLLRMLYAKSLANSDDGRGYKINQLIGLEKRLSKFENILIGIEKNTTILNILEDCKENNDKDLVSRMLKFVDNYYSRESTI